MEPEAVWMRMNRTEKAVRPISGAHAFSGRSKCLKSLTLHFWRDGQ